MSAAGYFVVVADSAIFGVEVDFLKVGGFGCERARTVVLLLVGVAAGLVRELRGVETERSENFKVLDGVSSTDRSGGDCVEDAAASAALLVSSLVVVVISLSFRFFDGDAVSWQEGFSPSRSKSDLEEGRVPGLAVFVNC